MIDEASKLRGEMAEMRKRHTEELALKNNHLETAERLLRRWLTCAVGRPDGGDSGIYKTTQSFLGITDNPGGGK